MEIYLVTKIYKKQNKYSHREVLFRSSRATRRFRLCWERVEANASHSLAGGTVSCLTASLSHRLTVSTLMNTSVAAAAAAHSDSSSGSSSSPASSDASR